MQLDSSHRGLSVQCLASVPALAVVLFLAAPLLASVPAGYPELVELEIEGTSYLMPWVDEHPSLYASNLYVYCADDFSTVLMVSQADPDHWDFDLGGPFFSYSTLVYWPAGGSPELPWPEVRYVPDPTTGAFLLPAALWFLRCRPSRRSGAAADRRWR
jgi:hypothetical protein